MRNLPALQTTEQLYYANILRYDTVHLNRYRLAMQYMDENSKVLDYGCGAGYGSFVMSGEAGEVIAIDADRHAIAYAKDYYARKNITYLLMDWPPSDWQFDVITCFEVIEHVDEAEKLVAKFAELLKPGGILVCSVPNEAILPHADSSNHFHKRHYLPQDFDELIEKHFKIEKRCTQRGKAFGAIVDGWYGINLIAVCRKK